MLPFIYISGKPVAMYGLCIAAGIFIASLIARFLTKKTALAFEDFIIYGAVLFGLGFLGAKLFYIFICCPVEQWKQQLLYLVSDREKASAGFVFYGGLITGLGGVFIARAITGVKIKEMLPVFAVIMPVIHSFGRLGCFCAGCCYGIESESVFSVIYKNPVSSVKSGVGIFPVQLMEAFLLLVLFAWLLYRFYSIEKKSTLVFEYVCFYCLIRFVTEFFRGDVERGKIFFLSTSQFISLLLVFLFVAVLAAVKIRKSQVLETTGDF